MKLKTVITNNDFESNEVAKDLVNYLSQNVARLNLQNSTLYYKYPKYDNDTFPVVPDLLIVSPRYGIIVINSSDKFSRDLSNKFLENFNSDLNDLVAMITAQFVKIKSLRKSRDGVLIPINTIAHFPNCNISDITRDEYIITITSNSELKDKLEDICLAEDLNEDILRDVYSVIDGSRTIPVDNMRDISDEDKSSEGYILSTLEKQIATFDYKQKLAALTIVDGPQRIRGMAGSGKTVVLAMKAAQLHINNPEEKILYTFYTKSLYDQVKRLITRFYRMTQDHDPNWENLHILHAWGGINQPGVYYNTCISLGERPVNLTKAQNLSKDAQMTPFEFICNDLVTRNKDNFNTQYDYILIDEGQDFANSFYWLCRRLVKNDRIIWAYDELQNILDVEPQDSKRLFENHIGDEGIDLEELMERHPHQSNDIILKKSYRNPKEILVSAHSLGFGIYNSKIIQMLENKKHWEDMGYFVEEGGNIGEKTIIERPIENSPSIISKMVETDQIVTLQSFHNIQSETEYIAQQIKNDLEHKLKPEDIMVICLDDRFSRSYYDQLSFALADEMISINNIMNSAKGDKFSIKDQVTFSTVYRAKGNEAGKVYIIGADSLKSRDSIKVRNKLFTALTRSKGWVQLTGCGIEDGFISEELKEVRRNDFKLIFNYPSQEDIKYTVQRELSDVNEQLNKKRDLLYKLIEDSGLTVEEATRLIKIED